VVEVSHTVYEVRAERDDAWWVLTVPAVPGAFSQARRLDQAPEMITDAISLVLGVPESSFSVTVLPVVDEDVRRELAEADRLHAEAQEIEEAAAGTRRRAVAALRRQGLTVRDIAKVTGVSFQRVAQLLADRRRTS
jgi:predicted RNase H-like HicB family nuclease